MGPFKNKCSDREPIRTHCLCRWANFNMQKSISSLPRLSFRQTRSMVVGRRHLWLCYLVFWSALLRMYIMSSSDSYPYQSQVCPLLEHIWCLGTLAANFWTIWDELHLNNDHFPHLFPPYELISNFAFRSHFFIFQTLAYRPFKDLGPSSSPATRSV